MILKVTQHFVIQDIESRLPLLEQSNLSKLQATVQQASDAYEETIENVIKNQPLCLHLLDFEAVHSEAVLAAMNIYDTQVKIISDNQDHKKAELKQVNKVIYLYRYIIC